MTRFAVFAAFTGLALATATPVLAHTELVRSNPAANATVKNAPRAITLTFNERLVPRFSKFELTMPAHDNMAVAVRTAVSPDGKRIVGTLAKPLGKGDYRVTWTAAGADGHRLTGTVNFKVA
jgi:methionine-rich copper-binding protein CopC